MLDGKAYKARLCGDTDSDLRPGLRDLMKIEQFIAYFLSGACVAMTFDRRE
jgi:hypothetical protein